MRADDAAEKGRLYRLSGTDDRPPPPDPSRETGERAQPRAAGVVGPRWNEPAIRLYYRGIRAVPMDEWMVYRLSGEALDELVVRGR